MKVAAIQMVSVSDVNVNVRRAHDLLRRAAEAGAELAVLPEHFCQMGQRDTDKLAIQEPYGSGVLQQFLADVAQELGLWVVAGTIPLTGDGPATQGVAPRLLNSSLVFSPEGLCVARYDKMHLFKFDNGVESYDESRVMDAGTHPVSFELPSRDGHVWRVGLSVCYDLRFPELYRTYAAAGAHLVLVPSAFTHTTGECHWEVLLRARAIENLCFLAAAAQGGMHDNGRHTWGRTMLVSPWGKVLGQLDQGDGVVVTELSFDDLADCRSRLPALGHRVL